MSDNSTTEFNMKIIGISGSLRQRSFNTALLYAAARLLPETVELEVIDLSPFPFYNGDLDTDGPPEAVRAVERKIAEADGVLIASPEYNHSYSGVLKNAIDWISRPPIRALSEKPVAVIGATPGRFGTARGQMNTRQLLHAIGAYVLPKPELLVTQAPIKFDDERQLTDEDTIRVYRTLLENFVRYIDLHSRTAQPV